MFDYLLDARGDLDFSIGTVQTTDSDSQLAVQEALIILNTFRGEWEFNIEFGIPYLRNQNNPIQLLGQPDSEIFESYIRTSLLAAPHIQDIIILNLSFERSTGLLSGEVQFVATDSTTLALTL